MATRSKMYKQYATELVFVVGAAGVVTQGCGVKFSTTDETVTTAAAGEDTIGVAMTSGAAGERVRVCTPWVAVVPVKVAPGGTAPRGKRAVVASGGFTDAPTLGGGTTARNCAGVFIQSGVAGDDVAMGVQPVPAVST